MEFPTTYVDRNGDEWYCETFADYLYCVGDDTDEAEDDPSQYEGTFSIFDEVS
jgi:hypothetical protein